MGARIATKRRRWIQSEYVRRFIQGCEVRHFDRHFGRSTNTRGTRNEVLACESTNAAKRVVRDRRRRSVRN